VLLRSAHAYNDRVNARDQYHVGMVVDDLDEALAWLADIAGYRWCEELKVDNLLVTKETETIVPLRFTYSMDEPHVEVIQEIPGTFFAPAQSSPHHVGYWSDDIDGDLDVLEAAGATVDGRGYWPDGRGPIWAFATPPVGSRIELVDRSSKPNMELWWSTGVRGG
jgi:catechol 2,3-dioxygenase-like lactoylglutathione lyase family enzyme